MLDKIITLSILTQCKAEYIYKISVLKLTFQLLVKTYMLCTFYRRYRIRIVRCSTIFPNKMKATYVAILGAQKPIALGTCLYPPSSFLAMIFSPRKKLYLCWRFCLTNDEALSLLNTFPKRTFW